MLNIYSAFNWIAGILFASFTLFLFLGSKRPSTRAYALVAASLAVWSFAMGLYYMLEGHATLLFLNKLNHFAGALVGPIFLYFTLLFPEEKKPAPNILRSLIIAEIGLALIYFFTDLVIKDTFIVRGAHLNEGWQFGDWGALFHLNLLLPFFGGFYILWQKMKLYKNSPQGDQLRYIFWATVIGSLPSMWVNVFLPLVGSFNLSWLGPVLTVSWVILISYAITRYQLLSVKIVTSIVALLILIVILFVNIFIPAEFGLSLAQKIGSAPIPPLNIYSGVIWLVSMILGSFSFLLYLGSKERATRVYALVGFGTALWALGMGAYYYTDQESWLIFWNRYNHGGAGIIASLCFYFSFLFSERKSEDKYPWVLPGILLSQLLLFYLYFYSDLVIKDTYFVGKDVVDRQWLFGKVGFLFYLTFFSYFGGGFYILYQKLKITVDPFTKNQLRYLFYGSGIGVIPATLAGIFLPMIGNFSLYWSAPLLTLGWVIFTSYAIVRYHVLSVRLVLAEISVFVMSGILFANIFVEELTLGAVSRFFVFLAFAIVGGFFIKNIVKNEEQKEELSALALKLKDLNRNLEKKVEERTGELRKVSIHNETLIENLTSGLIEYSNDFKIIRVNRAAERMLGLKRNEVVGLSIKPEDVMKPRLESLAIVTYPIVGKESVHLAEESTGDKTISANEVKVSYPEENEYHVVTAPIILPGGGTSGFIKIVRDITREKLIARSKSEFISIAAHQLRTPLSIIKWTLNTLLSGDMGKLNKKQIEAMDQGYQTNEKMIGLINDLLDVARIEDGRFGYEFEKRDLTTLVESVVKDYEMIAKKKMLNLNLEISRDPLPNFYFDSSKINLALRNILDNAVNYTKPGDQIRIKLKNEGDLAEIEITDSGIGIPLRQQNRLFTKFFRGENAIRLNTEGSGLGLFISKNIIQKHRGEIDIHSEEGVGTKVRINLPLSKEKPVVE